MAAGHNCMMHQPVLAPAYRPSVARLREHYHRSLTGKHTVRTGVQGYAGRDTLLNGVPIEYKEDVARVIEQAERAAETSWTTIHTGESLYSQARHSPGILCYRDRTGSPVLTSQMRANLSPLEGACLPNDACMLDSWQTLPGRRCGQHHRISIILLALAWSALLRRLLHPACHIERHGQDTAACQREGYALWGLHPSRAAESDPGAAGAC